MRTITKMKMLISIVLVAFIATVVGCANWGHHEPPPVADEPAIEPTYPSFASVADVIAYQLVEKDYVNIHQLFLEMPAGVLANVAQVLIARNGSCTEETIVNEYLTNVNIYDNLAPPADTTQQEQPTIPPGNKDTAKQVQLRCTQADTVIGGIPYKQLKYQYDE